MNTHYLYVFHPYREDEGSTAGAQVRLQRGLGVSLQEGSSGHISDREVPKQWLEAKRLAGIPEAVVLYCARHRFSTDAMEGTGNVMAVMDAMGHQSVNTTRIYSHPELAQIREAMNKRNEAMQ